MEQPELLRVATCSTSPRSYAVDHLFSFDLELRRVVEMAELEEFARLDAESGGKLRDRGQGGILFPPFRTAEELVADASGFSQLLLGHACAVAQLAKPRAKLPPWIHLVRRRGGMMEQASMCDKPTILSLLLAIAMYGCE